MSDFEFDDWRSIRTGGCGWYLLTTMVRRCVTFAWPVAVMFFLAHLVQGKDDRFWENNKTLLGSFAAITFVIGIGEGLYGWTTRERRFDRSGDLSAARSAGTASIFERLFCRQPSSRAVEQGGKKAALETSLIYEARGFQARHDQDGADLDQQCARFGPILRSTLATETYQLAIDAGVSDQAAFLALMRQFEN